MPRNHSEKWRERRRWREGERERERERERESREVTFSALSLSKP